MLGLTALALIVTLSTPVGGDDPKDVFKVALVSGDKIILRGHLKTLQVRLIGATLPGKPQTLAEEAAIERIKKALTGRDVRVQLDPAVKAKPIESTPAFLFDIEEDIFINADLLEAGLARPNGDKPSQLADQLQQAAAKGSEALALYDRDVADQKERLPKLQAELARLKAEAAAKEAAKPRYVHFPEYMPQPGDIAFLHIDGVEGVVVASDVFHCSEMARYAMASDTVGLQQLLDKGWIWREPAGVRVKVISDTQVSSHPQWEVRLQEGKKANRAVYVLAEFLAQPKAADPPKSPRRR